jgi:murein L,D-transpeptidase YcbB/YkuD
MAKIVLGFLFVLLITTGCNNEKASKKESSKNLLSQNLSGLLIDSIAVHSFSKLNNASDSIGWEVNKFYKRRNYQFAWFNKDGMTYAISIFYNQLQNYIYNFADSSLRNSRLDSFISASQKDEKGFLSNKNNVQQLELLLTSTFFMYAKKAYGGETKNLADLEWFIPRQKKDYQVALDSLIELPIGSKEQMPLNNYYFNLRGQLKKYRDIEKKGGFPVVIFKNKLPFKDCDSCLLPLKHYLYLTGDLKRNDSTIVFTDSLMNAVKNFQRRLGLVENGKIDSLMITELNRPIGFRIRQIMINMERLRWMPEKMEADYLIINIPEFKLHVIEGWKEVWASKVVVGQAATQTTVFKANLSQIILNPYWVVPANIARNEIIPKIKRSPSYLVNYNMEILSGNEVIDPSKINWSENKTAFTIRQKPGKNNALGKILFLFPNTFDIYLHDTPSKNLFEETQRDFSHGCIRVAEPERLALYLLRKNAKWNIEKVNKVLQTNIKTDISVLPTIPVYITYFTTWVDDKGQLNFRNDVYNLDSKLSKEIFGELKNDKP